ncbi:MAG: hypothetical protein HY231_27340 [Acidobacteria bacterium]|nr:hypothetical protein [Acidobacteriota bacterium]
MESTKRTKEQGGMEENKGHAASEANAASKSPGSKPNGEGGFKLGENSSEVLDQAKQVMTDAYNRTSKTLNETYTQAVDYGRENPGKMTLIAFGAGIGIGLLLANGLTPSRTRTGRLVPPVMNALSEIAIELFR